MKLQIATLLPLCLLILALGNTQVFVVKAYNGYFSEFMENIYVTVNCTTANFYVNSMIMSSNASLVHFPSEVNMVWEGFKNATGISLGFSTDQSFLICAFNNTSPVTARTLADEAKPSIESAFGSLSFAWYSTGTSDSQVNVTYTGSGMANLTSYIERIMLHCLASDLGGFSLTFLPMTRKPGAFTQITAIKESGEFEWTYSMMIIYYSSIPTGVGPHKIDILDLLNVSSLAPSPYAYTSIPFPHYSSVVYLQIWSSETLSFVGCEPDLASPPGSLRGWYVSMYGGTMNTYFSFADDPTPVSPLTLTFSGTVIPEFKTPALIIALTLIATITLVMKKRIPKI